MLTSRLLAVAGAVAIVAGASVARADIRFQNVTGQPLVFQIRCHGGGLVQTFRLAPRSYDDIYCINGADAEMRVYTERDNGDRIVVHGTCACRRA